MFRLKLVLDIFSGDPLEIENIVDQQDQQVTILVGDGRFSTFGDTSSDMAPVTDRWCS